MRNKGFTLIELLILVAILGIIAAVIIPNIGRFMQLQDAKNETQIQRYGITELEEDRYMKLRHEPLFSLNISELEFLVEYYFKWANISTSSSPERARLQRALICQNQILILEEDNAKVTSVDTEEVN